MIKEILLLIGLCTCINSITKFGFTDGCVNATSLFKIFRDKMSGTKKQPPGLEEALEFAREGDTIVVWRLDRLGRNMHDLIQIEHTE